MISQNILKCNLLVDQVGIVEPLSVVLVHLVFKGAEAKKGLAIKQRGAVLCGYLPRLSLEFLVDPLLPCQMICEVTHLSFNRFY